MDLCVCTHTPSSFWRHRVRRRAPIGVFSVSRRRLFAVFNHLPLTYLAPNPSHFVADSPSIDLSVYTHVPSSFVWHRVRRRVPIIIIITSDSES